MIRTHCLCLLLAAISLSCGPAEQPEADLSSDAPQAVIGVSLLTMTHDFFQQMTQAMKDEAARHNMEVIINTCEFDIARQQNQVSDFVVKQVDAIVLAPCDSKAIGTSIQEANAAGIPVLTVDIAALADNIDVLTHIATDNLEGGRMAARAVIEAIGRTGEIAIIDHPEVESVILRTRGFKEVIDAANADGADLRIVKQLPSLGVKDRAFRVAEDVLQAHPGLDAFFAINDQCAIGAVAAIEKAGKAGEVAVIGFDGSPEGKAAIKAGQVHADVIQYPVELGKQVVNAVLAYQSGEDVAPEYLVAPGLYRQADAEADPALQSTGTE